MLRRETLREVKISSAETGPFGSLTIFGEKMINCYEDVLLEFSERSDSRVIPMELSSIWHDGFRDVTPGQLWLDGREEEALVLAEEEILRTSWRRREKGAETGPKAFSIGQLRETLKECEGSRTEAARKLGVAQSCVGRWASETGVPVAPYKKTGPKAFTRERLVAVLAACGGNQLAAGRVLGIPERTLYRWGKAWGLSRRTPQRRAT